MSVTVAAREYLTPVSVSRFPSVVQKYLFFLEVPRTKVSVWQSLDSEYRVCLLQAILRANQSLPCFVNMARKTGKPRASPTKAAGTAKRDDGMSDRIKNIYKAEIMQLDRPKSFEDALTQAQTKNKNLLESNNTGEPADMNWIKSELDKMGRTKQRFVKELSQFDVSTYEAMLKELEREAVMEAMRDFKQEDYNDYEDDETELLKEDRQGEILRQAPGKAGLLGGSGSVPFNNADWDRWPSKLPRQVARRYRERAAQATRWAPGSF